MPSNVTFGKFLKVHSQAHRESKFLVLHVTYVSLVMEWFSVIQIFGGQYFSSGVTCTAEIFIGRDDE